VLVQTRITKGSSRATSVLRGSVQAIDRGVDVVGNSSRR
jgi:hypothetical protein